jgi:adenylate cyclase class 2
LFEYEVKLSLDGFDVDFLKRKLCDLGFKHISHRFEEDHYIDFRGCVNYVEDSALRIRIYKSSDGGIRYKLTFKGPRSSMDVKVREEIEMDLADDRLLEIFRKLGFRDLVVRKVRDEYSRGDLKVCIDDVEGLGVFMEVEVLNPESKEAYMNKLMELLSSLNLSNRPLIVKTYLELLLQRGI